MCAVAGIRCNALVSSASMWSGRRRVTRCSREFTMAMNPAQAASSSANEAYWSRRLVSFGTRSALASFTAFSTPPLAAGSAGWQVSTSTP